MTQFDLLLDRNRSFAGDADARRKLAEMPGGQVFIISCIDPRVEPATFLGVGIGDAIVMRNAGGRITDAAIADIAFISYLGEMLSGDTARPPLEVAVIHHTHCGTGFLADEGFRHNFAERTGFDETALADEAVVDPEVTIRTDVERLLSSPHATSRLLVSGHVFDLDSGLVRTVVPATAPYAHGEVSA